MQSLLAKASRCSDKSACDAFLAEHYLRMSCGSWQAAARHLRKYNLGAAGPPCFGAALAPGLLALGRAPRGGRQVTQLDQSEPAVTLDLTDYVRDNTTEMGFERPQTLVGALE